MFVKHADPVRKQLLPSLTATQGKLGEGWRVIALNSSSDFLYTSSRDGSGGKASHLPPRTDDLSSGPVTSAGRKRTNSHKMSSDLLMYPP